MSLQKKIFGYFLIVISFLLIIITGLPNIYANSMTKIKKTKEVNLTFLQNESSKIVLLYFGYVGCDTICTPSLTEINKIYQRLSKDEKKQISVYFVNLLDVIDKDLPNLFARYFNKDFKGIYLDKKEILSILNQFDIVFSKSLVDKYNINHSGYLYLLIRDKNSYYQKYIYITRPFDIDIIEKDIKQIIRKG